MFAVTEILERGRNPSWVFFVEVAMVDVFYFILSFVFMIVEGGDCLRVAGCCDLGGVERFCRRFSIVD